MNPSEPRALTSLWHPETGHQHREHYLLRVVNVDLPCRVTLQPSDTGEQNQPNSNSSRTTPGKCRDGTRRRLWNMEADEA